MCGSALSVNCAASQIYSRVHQLAYARILRVVCVLQCVPHRCCSCTAAKFCHQLQRYHLLSIIHPTCCSVGSGAVSIVQALVVASVFEFLGALFLGTRVTNTVRKDIVNLEEFYDQPEVFMYGNLCALAATGLWLQVSSFLELPVSTTHSISK